MTLLPYWLPIVVSAAVVFIASAAVWMGLKWHNLDFRKTADEPAVRAALKGADAGFYLVPFHLDPGELKDPEVQKKFVDGPQAYVTVLPNGMPKMAGKLVSTFVLYLFIGTLCAYVLSFSTAATYLEAFRVTATTAWIAHGVAYLQESIWFGRPWGMTIKNLVDALIYGLLTGGVFGWLA